MATKKQHSMSKAADRARKNPYDRRRVKRYVNTIRALVREARRLLTHGGPMMNSHHVWTSTVTKTQRNLIRGR